MTSNTCPLCGGKLKNSRCESCGYSVPESEKLSALYNYDPSDYPQPQEEIAPIREMFPDKTEAEEIYPNRPDPIIFKVRNDDGKTVKGGYDRTQPPYANAQPPAPYADRQALYPNNNRYANQGNQGARQNNAQVYYTPPNQNNPYANINPLFQAVNQPARINSFNELFKKYWWLMLICFLMPVAGIFVLSALKRIIGKQYTWVFVLVLILGMFLPP